MLPIIQLIRVEQWVKNLFIFVPAFFAGVIFHPEHTVPLLLAFFCFSFTASAVYILNDYKDIKKDRLHPVKKDRPLAGGTISKRRAIVLFVVLLGAGTGIAVLFLPQAFFFLCGGYFLMNVGYTFVLKKVAIVDVCTIATGFVLRVLSGGVAVDVPVTNWLILMTFLLALILAIGKRRGEYVALNGETGTRSVLAGYNLEFLNTALAFSCTITVVSYIMYTVSGEVVQRLNTEYLYMTTLFVVLGALRYLQQSMVFNRAESPTKLLFNDHFIQIVLLGWVLTFLGIIYWK